jgi:hypothetical protein
MTTFAVRRPLSAYHARLSRCDSYAEAAEIEEQRQSEERDKDAAADDIANNHQGDPNDWIR